MKVAMTEDFVISAKSIRRNHTVFICDSEVQSGVRKIAGKVCNDAKAVFGLEPAVVCADDSDKIDTDTTPIIFVTDGVGTLFDRIEKAGIINASEIRNKWEVYSFTVVNGMNKSVITGNEGDTEQIGPALIIAGSDKRGTIYGLFRLSELMGVSPFIDWLDVQPMERENLTIEAGTHYVSKEPSVRYRGFFINDEWPAFGNYCNKRFGGFNRNVYEHIFELLLRLKGNYMWPAMWSAVFSEDGPGLANAELADELGVVMGMSHHEPCLRHGEEYSHVRGKDSIYGDAWNFHTNREGITRFWEDGLIRSGKFENVITVGMRGEADSAILGHDATLKDNIDLLRDVLKTQNRLIRENVNEEFDKVPRMLALYKEVEPYFYGDENTKGLMDDPELDGVTLMLCDDNFGNLRTVPTEHMLGHKGGYGMYYHFDYHGWPVSYEWFNTTYLPKVWEQMTSAYDFGIRDLWIVNVGDVFTNEYPLSFFLDLAYDFDKWGTKNVNSVQEYTDAFVETQFSEKISESEKRSIAELLFGYTKILGSRRTEAMNADIYTPFDYFETEKLIHRIDELMERARQLRADIEGNANYTYYQLVYLPLIAGLNVQRMWLVTGLNHAYAKMGSTYASALANEVERCYEADDAIINELHTIHEGMWYGMGLSEHIGFKEWNEEECSYPILYSVRPSNKDRLIVTVTGEDASTQGLTWTKKTLQMRSFLNPAVDEGRIGLCISGRNAVPYKATVNADYIALSFDESVIYPGELGYIIVKVDRDAYRRAKKNELNTAAEIVVKAGEGIVKIKVPVNLVEEISNAECDNKTFLWYDDHISIDAHSFHDIVNVSVNGKEAGFRVLPDYGRTVSAVKAYPQNIVFEEDNAPALVYKIHVPDAGRYDFDFYTNPSNPYRQDRGLRFMLGANGSKPEIIEMIPEGFKVGDGNNIWRQGVLDNIRNTHAGLELKAGVNFVKVYALDPNFVLEKIVITKEGKEIRKSYLGPEESFSL